MKDGAVARRTHPSRGSLWRRFARRSDPVDAPPLAVNEHAGAALLGISYWSFRELTSAGIIPLIVLPSPLNPKKAMRRRLVAVADIHAFIATHKQGGGQ